MPLKTITVAGLRKLLDGYDDDDPVVFATNYGNRGRTLQAHPIAGSMDDVSLVRSAYSESGYAVAEDDEAEGPWYLRLG